MASSHRSEQSASPNRIMLRRALFLTIVCGIVAFVGLTLRLFDIQILHHERYETAAVEQQLRQTTVPARRGTIYDRNYNILAMSGSVSNIYISPAEIQRNNEDKELIADGLSEILGVDRDKILEKMENTSSWYATIKLKVDDETVEAVRSFKEENSLRGVKIEEATKRYYPYSSLASHVIGFVGVDDYGLAGLEYSLDSTLSGIDGRVVRATNAAGTDMLFTDFEDYYDAQDGEDVVLTIDTTVQYYLEKYLSLAVQDYMVQNGACGIVMDVKTGAVLAMASLDNFDLNDYLTVSSTAQARVDAAETETERDELLSEERTTMWRNKAVSDTYEPGSTFKIITLAMALETGAVSEASDFYCGGSVDVLGRTNPVNCWRSGGHGSETLAQAVMNSCNVAFVQIGQRVGAERFYEYARAFGFFDKTGIDLPGEAGSLWWDDDVFCDPLNRSQLAAASFGQTFTITPIQLITAVSAVANGGYLMRPYLVSDVLDENGGTVSHTEPTVVRQVISEQTSAICCNILEQVVGSEGGTGKNAYVAGYRIGGKTGTSTKTSLEASTGEKEYIVSFVGIAPADDPEIAVLVLLDTPSSNCGVYISGGQMAAPTVGNIMADVLPYLGVKTAYSEEEKALADREVPALRGMALPLAVQSAEDAGFSYRVVGEGDSVTDQLPAAGAVIAAGSELVLYCGTEPEAAEVTVPALSGLSYEAARAALADCGLYLRDESGILGGEGVTVVGQTREAGSTVTRGSVVGVSLSDSANLGRY